MTDAPIALQARRLTKVLGRRVVLDEVDLDVAAGESVALTGSNGAGKTTLLRLLSSVLRPNAGEVRWFGRPAPGDPAARRLIGMVAHESLLYPQLTLRENLLFAARMCGVPQAARRAERLLAEAGLEHHGLRLPGEVSRGMRQRLSVARALVHDPPILLLDEPFAGLDAAGTQWLASLLMDLRGRGTALCFALHDGGLVQRLADRVVSLRSGRLEEVEVVRSSPGGKFLPPVRAA